MHQLHLFQDYNIMDVKAKNQDSSVSNGEGHPDQVQFLAVQDFSLLHHINAGSGALPPSYPMYTVGEAGKTAGT
jgi:hypothetical protein